METVIIIGMLATGAIVVVLTVMAFIALAKAR